MHSTSLPTPLLQVMLVLVVLLVELLRVLLRVQFVVVMLTSPPTPLPLLQERRSLR